MFIDGGSDYEYDDKGHQRYLFCKPHERLLQREEAEARRNTETTIRDWLQRIAEPEEERAYLPGKQLLRQYYSKMNYSKHPNHDWRRWRFFRFFLDLQGFHQGYLDLTPRTPERYNKLICSWTMFIRDFERIESLPTVVPAQATPEEPDTVEAGIGNVNDTELLHQVFRETWDIPKTVTMEDIQHYVGRTRDVMQTFPQPVFQRIFLIDLPPELLGMMFSFAELDDARNCSAACHQLRDIGQSYIYVKRRVLVRYPRGLHKLIQDTTAEEELQSHVAAALSQNLDLCIDECDFLLSRSDICSRVVDLTFGHYLSGTTLALARGACDQRLSDLADRFADILSATRLKKFRTVGIQFERSHAEQLVAQSTLVRCILDSCSTSDALREYIVAQPPGAFDSRLESLTIIVDRDDQRDTFWPLLALFPRLRLLRVSARDSSFEATTFWAPDPILFMGHLSYTLRNVERLSLEATRLNSDLRNWFRAAGSHGPIRLTHFKLEDAHRMTETRVIDLLRVLHGCRAPLEVLSLDGILPVSTELFDVLSQLFPGLRGLTVHRHAGRRLAYYQRKRTRWECPLHEYAAYFRRFTRLRHFGANFYWDDDARSPRAIDLLLNRDAYADNELYDIQMIGYRDVVLPFAAYCPSMTTMRVACDSDWRYDISRSESGAIVMEDPPPPFLATSPLPARMEPYELWDPCGSHAWTLPGHDSEHFYE